MIRLILDDNKEVELPLEQAMRDLEMKRRNSFGFPWRNRL